MSLAISYLPLAAVGISLAVLWVAGRRRRGIKLESDAFVLRYHIAFRVIPVVGAFAVPVALTELILAHPSKDQGDDMAWIGVNALFFCLNVPLLWETTLFAVVVSPKGLDCHSAWRSRRFIAWDDVAEVSHRPLTVRFIVRASDGWCIRIPEEAQGIQQFLEECTYRLPPAMLVAAEPGLRRIGMPHSASENIGKPGQSWQP